MVGASPGDVNDVDHTLFGPLQAAFSESPVARGAS
jgi:hypothetical protein